MGLVSSILAEIEQESRTTRKVLERVPTDKLTWKPHEKSSALGRLAWHIASIPARALAMVRDGDFDMATARPLEPPDSTALIVAGFERHTAEVRAYFESIDEAVLHEPFTLRRGPQVIVSMKKIGAVRAILLNHTYHHRGQLSVYLRLLDVPVPPIYGPTADEMM
jgi:uncharacterized damage-inducible protein DinB